MPLQAIRARQQMKILCWEQFIGEENPVRVVDAFVDYFDLAALDFQIKGKSNEGRPAYATATLAKLYIYGYLNRIRSGRQLAKAAQTNIELLWLLGEARPCYKTITEFRRINAQALKNLFKSWVQFLRGQDLCKGDLIAIDGSKFAAQNSKKNNYNETKVKQHLDYIEKQTQQYLTDLDQVDAAEEAGLEQITEIAQKLDHLKSRKDKYQSIQAQLVEARAQGDTQVSTTDADARALPKKMNIVEMGYNVQVAAEAEHKLVTNIEVTNKNDGYALSRVALESQKVLNKKELTILADKGYDTGHELKICADQQITTIVAPKKRQSNKKNKQFAKQAFFYDAELDQYRCPQDQVLKTNGTWYKKKAYNQHRADYQFQRYTCSYNICRHCPFKLDCVGEPNLKNSKGKFIERSEYEPYIEDNIARYKVNKERYRLRQQIVEHPFGTIKRQWGYHYTLLKGMEKVSGEFHLIFTCYNLRRAMSIFGVKGLIRRLKAAFFGLLTLWQLLIAVNTENLALGLDPLWCRR